MIYADVTSACLLPLQSGIPRTTRGLYRQLVGHAGGVTPLMWQPFYHGYTKLPARAGRLLEDPFYDQRSDSPPPGDWLGPLLRASLGYVWKGPGRLPLGRKMGKGDTLVVTSLFPDNRMAYLRGILKGPGRKVVFFHDAIPLVDPHVPRLARPFHRALLGLLAGFDLVVCVSRTAEADLLGLWERYGIQPAPTRVIAWPVPFLSDRPAFTPPDSRKKTLLYVSRLKRVKNHAVLLQACEALWNEGLEFRLELIGCEDVPAESRAILEAVKDLQRRGYSVAWHGHVDETELHAAYARCTFTVFPSLMEGFGLPIVESLWHGRPVVCGEGGAMGEVSRGAGTVGVDVTRPEALATAIRGLLADPERCAALAGEAYRRPVRTWGDYWKELEPHL